MKQELQKELSAHLRVINGRENFIKKWQDKKEKQIRDFKDNWKGEEEILKIIHLKAKEYLDKKGFNFGKDRDYNSSLIIWEDGFVKEREYKQRSFYNVDFTENGLQEFLPRGFQKAVIELMIKLHKIGKLNINFKSTIKLNKNNKFYYLDYQELKKEKAEKIILGKDKSYPYNSSDLSIETDGYTSKEEWAYYNAKVFKKILKLMKKYEKNFKNILIVREKLRQEAEDFVNNQFNKIVILESLKDE